MYGDQRDRNVQTHSFPTRRSSDRQDGGARNRGSDKSLLALDEKQASDQPAHAMAEQQARGVGMVDLDQRQQLGHAVEIGREARQKAALSARPAMPPMIDRIDRPEGQKSELQYIKRI